MTLGMTNSKRLCRPLTALAAVAALMPLPSTAFAQKEKEVTGRFEFFLPRHISRATGEQMALERAMIDALANEFGTSIQQDIRQTTSVTGDSETSDYWSSASTLVKGEWVETIGQPKYGIRLQGDDIVISCEVKGKAREIKSNRADLDVKVLREGTTDEFESSTFYNGDKLFLAFTSPVDGYIAIYLEDDQKNMIRMLPFPAERGTSRKVEANRRYVFFVSNDGFEEQYAMTTSKQAERNSVHVVFSPNAFVKPVEQAADFDEQMKMLDTDKFRKWFSKARTVDPELQEVVRPITISLPID